MGSTAPTKIIKTLESLESLKPFKSNNHHDTVNLQ